MLLRGSMQTCSCSRCGKIILGEDHEDYLVQSLQGCMDDCEEEEEDDCDQRLGACMEHLLDSDGMVYTQKLPSFRDDSKDARMARLKREEEHRQQSQAGKIAKEIIKKGEEIKARENHVKSVNKYNAKKAAAEAAFEEKWRKNNTMGGRAEKMVEKVGGAAKGAGKFVMGVLGSGKKTPANGKK